MKACGLSEICNVSSLEMMTLIVAGACHDFEHPGVNNAYLTETKSELALKYNGKRSI